ncbi:LOW QUALITY PROTEIN: hypothetical protein V1478_015707 [Vespula squamosa]|uniref:Uncharacterized protein n=1 Tax=Vespula squamosa TaxID=30214 RepID=A0ABD2A224_VESSQ
MLYVLKNSTGFSYSNLNIPLTVHASDNYLVCTASLAYARWITSSKKKVDGLAHSLLALMVPPINLYLCQGGGRRREDLAPLIIPIGRNYRTRVSRRCTLNLRSVVQTVLNNEGVKEALQAMVQPMSIISSIISIKDGRKRGSTTESGGLVSWNNRIPYVRCTPQKTGKKSRSASTTVRGEGSTTLAFRRLLLRNRRHFYFFLPVEFHVVIAKQAKMENVSEDVDDVKKLEAPLLLVRRGQRQGIAACTFRSVIYKAERYHESYNSRPNFYIAPDNISFNLRAYDYFHIVMSKQSGDFRIKKIYRSIEQTRDVRKDSR